MPTDCFVADLFKSKCLESSRSRELLSGAAVLLCRSTRGATGSEDIFVYTALHTTLSHSHACHDDVSPANLSVFRARKLSA